MKLMTMTQLLQNPTGPYSAYFARRDLTIQNLNDRYMQMLRDKKEFKIEMYSDKDDFYFYLKVPSETHEKLHYDVVIKFSPMVEQAKTDMTINNYSVNLFSNSPNFMFTYTYVYNQDGILIDFLKKKLAKKALEEPPVIKNPAQSYGFEKSVYYALLYIKGNRLNVKASFRSKLTKLNKSKLFDAVDSSEEKFKQYNRAKDNGRERKKDEKQQKRVAKKSNSSYNEKVDRSSSDSRKAKRQMTMKEQMTIRKESKDSKSVNLKQNMKRDMSVKKKKR